MEWLKDDLREDPWITFRFRKYMANPKRWPWKNYRECRDNWRYNLFRNWMWLAVLLWPAAILMGRRARHYQGGVPVVPYQRFIHDWPNMKPGHQSQKWFWRYFSGTLVIGGGLIAYFITNDDMLKNNWYTRPDLRPFPAMVENPTEYDKDQFDQVMQQNYHKFRDHRDKEEGFKKSLFKRFFAAQTANFNTQVNLYHDRPAYENYYAENQGRFPMHNNTYIEHVQN